LRICLHFGGNAIIKYAVISFRFRTYVSLLFPALAGHACPGAEIKEEAAQLGEEGDMVREVGADVAHDPHPIAAEVNGFGKLRRNHTTPTPIVSNAVLHDSRGEEVQPPLAKRAADWGKAGGPLLLLPPSINH